VPRGDRLVELTRLQRQPVALRRQATSLRSTKEQPNREATSFFLCSSAISA
jgi:hypothetical protein